MSVNNSTYSGKQFEVYIATDASVGNKFVVGNWSGANRLDVEGITLPSFAPTQEFEMRSGSGRIAEFDQIFSTSKRVITEFTLSGRLTFEAWTILLENVLSTELAGTDASLMTVPLSYAPTNFGDSDAIASVTTYSKTLSVNFKSPTSADDSYSLTGCVCTSLSVDADMDSSSGRFNYSATFQTMYAPIKGTQSVTSATAIGSNFIFLPDLDDKILGVMKYDGDTSDDDIEPLFKTFNLSIESPTQFLGAQGANAEPEVFARATPELTINFGGTIKYDELTDNMIEAFRDARTAGTSPSYIFLYLSDVDKAAGTYEVPTGSLIFAAGSTSKFGFQCAKAKLTSAEVSSDDVAMLSFEAKVLEPASGATAYFLAGDNAV